MTRNPGLLKGTALVRAALALITFAGVVGPAYAAGPAAKVKCSDASIAQNCDGRDPVAQGCDVETQVVDRVKLLDRNNQRVGVLRLIFSKRCATFWGRVVSDRGDSFDVSLTSVANNDLKIFLTSQARTGVSTTANSPMRFLPQNAIAGVFLVVSGTGETISRSTRSCPPPGNPNACSAPVGPDN
jgi:hypothetical protein